MNPFAIHPGDGYNMKMVSNMREDIYIDVPKGPFPHIIIIFIMRKN